jgi:hypothetical protein
MGLVLLCIGPLFAIPAVICGHISLGRIKRSAGALAGEGMAITGLVLGYVSIAILPLLAAIAVPSFVKARQQSMKHACINNLRIMDAAKEEAAMECRWNSEQEVKPGSPEERSALEYVKGNQRPVCPAGGTYEWNSIGENPTCSIPEHRLP